MVFMPDPHRTSRTISEVYSQGGTVTVDNHDPMKAFPEQQADYKQGVAPAGETFGSDLPVRSITGPTPYTTGGYSPSGGNPALEIDLQDHGAQKPPTGDRK